ncbi:hypothetical protein C457_13499 [Haloferax prahovense DSM 18310]|uniref:Uncharacterized protein n=1 Tax=Haloferax prahovense (strain DSM 18310 / JCM 13924 / TL6) TaxID=1227461 RepID=M0G4F9_HALPT|nr:hypothetical protein C457_13499 [Haloferax prahovense DSM 18310]
MSKIEFPIQPVGCYCKCIKTQVLLQIAFHLDSSVRDVVWGFHFTNKRELISGLKICDGKVWNFISPTRIPDRLRQILVTQYIEKRPHKVVLNEPFWELPYLTAIQVSATYNVFNL